MMLRLVLAALALTAAVAPSDDAAAAARVLVPTPYAAIEVGDAGLLRGVPSVAKSRTAPALGPRVVIVVRHAEVVVDGSGDPPLSDAGRARAQVLADIAASFDVDATFVTPFRRTTNTALPTSERQGLKSVAVPIPAGGVSAHVADLAARVQAASGYATLVVGHSNTVPPLILSLTGVDVGTIEETEFNRLFIVRFPVDGPATVEQLTY